MCENVKEKMVPVEGGQQLLQRSAACQLHLEAMLVSILFVLLCNSLFYTTERPSATECRKRSFGNLSNYRCNNTDQGSLAIHTLQIPM